MARGGHILDNPACGTLPERGCDLLLRVYDSALKTYDGDEKVASQVAWSVVKSHYRKVGSRWVRTNPCLPCLALANPGRRFPDPGPTVHLGRMLALHVALDGAIRNYRLSPGATLVWSPTLRALIAKPGLRLPPPRPEAPGIGQALRSYRAWAGRHAEGSSEVVWPDATLRKTGKAVAIVYRSDKWHAWRTDDYIHHFGLDVMAAIAGSKTRPSLFFVQGGRLRVTADGIEG